MGAAAPSPALSTPGADGPQAVRIVGLSKAFPGVQALDGVDLCVDVGEAHGLVGENGAGKSTLIKMLTGAYVPDDGTIEVFGQRMGHRGPRAQQREGVAAIYQELTIVPELSAAANVFLGRPIRRGPFLRARAMATRFEALAARLGVMVSPHSRAGSLSVANQQMLEIMRALEADHRILIMDEPTASLGPQEREHLYETVRRLKEDGTAIIYISHDLDEVLALCDRISVLREGQLVDRRPAADWTKETLVNAMLGSEYQPAAARGIDVSREELLRAEGLTVPGMLENVSFTLHRGEILGVAGLVGAGRTELLRALAGAQPGATGRIHIDGKSRPLPGNVRAALKLGIALAPEDRKLQGLVLSLNGTINVTLSDMHGVARAGIISERTRRAAAAGVAGPIAFDPARLGAPTAVLSGGNQQKLVVGKWLHHRPRMLLMDEPTRGIDVGAKAEMFAVMRRLAEEGMSIVMVSSELEEVIENADRVMVLAKGRRIAVLERAQADLERVLNLVFSVKGEA